MKDFNTIKEQLDAIGVKPEQLVNYGEDWNENEPELDEQIKNVIGEVTIVDSYGGEGQGDKWFRVYKLNDYDMYICVDAYYQSYDGVSFDSATVREVKPEVITKTIYK